jgi:hypothetical protein
MTVLPTVPTISLETFTCDLWEAMRSEVRDQLGDSVSSAEFDAQIPPWDRLPPETRWAKILIARDELLMVLDRAGYQVNKKRETS